jgi:hypothetical protein
MENPRQILAEIDILQAQSGNGAHGGGEGLDQGTTGIID